MKMSTKRLLIDLKDYLFCENEPGTLHLSNHTDAEHLFRDLFAILHQAGPPQCVDCLAPMAK